MRPLAILAILLAVILAARCSSRATILSDIFCNGWQAVFTVSVP